MTEVFPSEHAMKDRRALDAHQDARLVALAKQLKRNVTLGHQIARGRIPKAL